MNDKERVSREEFYKNLVWVLDGITFRQNFDIFHMLPAPDSHIAQDIVWAKAKRYMEGANRSLFFRVSEAREENPAATKATIRSGWIHSLTEIEEGLRLSYRGHHQYDWIRPRKTWLDSRCPVYIDFGNEYLVKLCIYDESGLACIRLVTKRKLLHDSMHETRGEDIATRFYPIGKGQHERAPQ